MKSMIWLTQSLTLAAWFFASALSAQQVYPPEFPAFATVEKTFFERYNPNSDFVDVYKKQEGYFIVLRSYDNPNAGEPLLFWSAAANSFVSLPLRRGPGSKKNFYNRADAANYDRQPCYGYPGWFHDAIVYLEKRDNPTDEELNALARAYSRAANNLILAVYSARNEADSSESFRLDPLNPRLLPDQANQYLRRTDRAIELYGQIMVRNPNFSTSVGPVVTKHANEMVDKYLNLSVLGVEKQARAQLPRGLYRPFIRECAYNMLQSCPPYAILLTWGDSDTYPLLYLQATENVRPDVLVANSSLLNSPFYNRHLRRDTVFGAIPPARTLPQTFYDQTAVLYLDETSALTINFPAYCRLLQEESYRHVSRFWATTYQLPIKAISIPVDNLAGREQVALPAHLSQTDTLRFDFGQYVFCDAQTTLDWLASNGWNRPVCFALTCHDQILKPFGAHLVQQGLVFRLYPIKPVAWKYGSPTSLIDVETTWQLWQNTFQWQSRDSITMNDGTPYLMAHYITALRMCNHLRESGDLLRARAILDEYIRLFPNTRLIWTDRMIHIAEAYARAGDKKSAAAVLSTLLDNYEQSRYDEQDRQAFENQREKIQETAKKYRLSEIRKRCERLFKN